jgi:hypothetical protein
LGGYWHTDRWYWVSSNGPHRIYITEDNEYTSIRSIEAYLPVNGSSGLQDALTALAGTGVMEVAITDLEVADANPDDYAAVVNACVSVSKCAGITVSPFFFPAVVLMNVVFFSWLRLT